jgi:hypothetical protein
MGIITKIFGGLSFFVGLLIVVGFPYVQTYQPESMAKGAILFGLLLMGIGIWLMTM